MSGPESWFEVHVRLDTPANASAQVSIRRISTKGIREEWIADMGYASDGWALQKAVWVCESLNARANSIPKIPGID